MAILGRLCRTLRPEKSDPRQPSTKGLAEALVAGVFYGSELTLQSLGAKRGNLGMTRLRSPALPDNPHVKVEKARSICQAGNDVLFNRNRMLVDLVIETLAEGDGVFRLAR